MSESSLHLHCLFCSIVLARGEVSTTALGGEAVALGAPFGGDAPSAILLPVPANGVPVVAVVVVAGLQVVTELLTGPPLTDTHSG